MVKKIIFDVDNTLIMAKDLLDEYKKIIDKYKIDTTPEQLYSCIGILEERLIPYNEEDLLKHINDYYNINLGNDFLNDLLESVCVSNLPLVPNLEETLKYLNSKYELYVLSNWFIESQIKRLELFGIAKYFKDFIGPDKFIKPNSDAFEYFYKDCKPSECVVIGDRYEIDIEVPLKLGMKAILYDYYDKYKDIDCIRITNWDDIKNIL